MGLLCGHARSVTLRTALGVAIRCWLVCPIRRGGGGGTLGTGPPGASGCRTRHSGALRAAHTRRRRRTAPARPERDAVQRGVGHCGGGVVVGHRGIGITPPPPPPPPAAGETAGKNSGFGGPSLKEREGKGSEWRSADRRRRLQTSTPNPRRHANTLSPPPRPRRRTRSCSVGGTRDMPYRTGRPTVVSLPALGFEPAGSGSRQTAQLR